MKITYLLFLMNLLVLPQAQALENWLDLKVEETIIVYKSPKVGGSTSGHLQPGTLVKISRKVIKKKWRQIEGRGYILESDIELSYIARKKEQSEEVASRFRHAGVTLYYSVLQQPGLSEDINDVSYEFSKFTGVEPAFELYYEFLLSRAWNLRLGLVSRQIYLTGTSTKKNLNLEPDDTTKDFKLLGGSLHFKKSIYKNIFFELGVEFSKTQSVEIKIADNALSTEDTNLPLFIIPNLGFGAEFSLGSKYYMAPMLNLGMDVNNLPNLMLIHFMLSVGFIF